MNEAISGWFLRIESDEKEFENDLIDFLEEGNYESTPEGLKAFLKSTLYDEPESQKGKANFIKDTLTENPELVAKSVGAIGDLLGKIVNKKFIKTK